MYYNVCDTWYKETIIAKGEGFIITEVDYVSPFYRLININSEVNSLLFFWEYAGHLKRLHRYNKDELISLLYYLKNNGIDLGIETEMWLVRENK